MILLNITPTGAMKDVSDTSIHGVLPLDLHLLSLNLMNTTTVRQVTN
jgi:hypothetical protein